MKRQIVGEMHGDEFLARQDSGWNVDDEHMRFDIYASSVERCRERMEKVESAPGLYATWARSNVTIIEKREPMAIGPWRPNRFLVLPSGFHAVLCYAPGR